MTDVPLFAGFDTPREPDPQLSPDRRRTQRQADAIAVGRHPLTGQRLHPQASRHRDADSPKNDPFTCGSCRFREVIGYHSRSYAKCLFGMTNEMRYLDDSPRISHSSATDVRAWWPACPDYSPGDTNLSPDAARYIP